MDKTTQIIIGIIVAIIILGGIWYGLSKKPTAPTTKEPIKIGVILPLTGEMANWGESMKGGIELAKDEINSKGGIMGRHLEIVYEDNQACDKALTVSAFRKLINIDKVKITMVGCSGAVLAVAPIAEENRVILLTPMASAQKFLKQAILYLELLSPMLYKVKL
jgi:branched-chain amino acid transport system substrate-binding protein